MLISLQITLKCRRYSSNSWCKCSRWWLIWWLILTLNKIRLNKWPCFNRCSRWCQWCRRWCCQTSNTLDSKRNNSNRRCRHPRNRVHKTTCSRIYSRQPRNQVPHHTSTQHRISQKLSPHRAPSTPSLPRGQVVASTNSPRLTPSAPAPKCPRNNNLITRLICLID